MALTLFKTVLAVAFTLGTAADALTPPCPGGSLDACIDLCLANPNPPAAFQKCIADCKQNCGSSPVPPPPPPKPPPPPPPPTKPPPIVDIIL